MLRKSRHLQMVLACVFLSLSFTAVARADPLVFDEGFTVDFDFQPLTAVVIFSGQAVNVSATLPFVVGNANWSLGVTVTLVDDPLLGDIVTLSGGLMQTLITCRIPVRIILRHSLDLLVRLGHQQLGSYSQSMVPC